MTQIVAAGNRSYAIVVADRRAGQGRGRDQPRDPRADRLGHFAAGALFFNFRDLINAVAVASRFAGQ